MTTSTTSDPLVGQILDGRYAIEARLARGGMATVYRAHDVRLGRIVALKIMHESLTTEDESFAIRFDREAKSAAKLVHPNVVAVFDQGEHDGRPFIAMELVDGYTLRHVIAKEAPKEPLQALKIMEPVVAALAAAHEAGLIHRDIKPENILISNQGEIKIGDFGLAKAISSQTASATQGSLIGTVSYLPPELVTTGKADARSDVYSTGIVLYELLTGKKPYICETTIQVAYAHVHNDVPAPSTAFKTGAAYPNDSRWIIPPYLDMLVQTCTRRQSADRPADARELLTLLREAKNALSKGILDDPKLTQMMDLRGGTVHKVLTPLSGPTPVTQRIGQSKDTSIDRFSGKSGWRPVTSSTQGAYTSLTPPDLSERTPVPRTISHAPVYRRRRRILVICLLFLVVLGIGAGSIWWQTEGRFTTAPALTSLTQEQALSTAQADELTITFAEEYSESVPAGQITRTDPEAGAKIPKKSQVYAWISKGPERYPVPELANKPIDEAKNIITNGHLSVGTISEEYSETVGAGVVISCSHRVGEQVKPKTKIDLVVSKGRQPIDIVNYVGKETETAKTELSGLGFEVEISEEFSDSVAAGLVISQTPSEGQGYKADKISIVSSKGPELVGVPKVGWKSESDAKKILENAGFKVEVVYGTESWLRLNIASRTSPAAGEMVAKGSTIKLYVV